jgi:hypothetical protein
MADNAVDIRITATNDAATTFTETIDSSAALSEQLAQLATQVGTLNDALLSLQKTDTDVAASQAQLGAETQSLSEMFRSQMNSMGESVEEFAEKARISATGVSSSFTAMGAIIGNVFIAGIFLEMLNRFKEAEIQMSHLSEATGLSIARIAEMKGAMETSGVSTDNFGVALQRLSRAIYSVSEGSPRAIQAFNDLGVSTKTWANEAPDAINVLLQMADHMATSSDRARDLGASTLLLGRNSREMVGFLAQGSEAIREQMEASKGMAEAQQAAAASAKALQQQEAELSRIFREALADVFPAVVLALRTIVAAGYEVMAAFEIIGKTIYYSLNTIVTAIASTGKALLEASSGNFRAAVDELSAGGERMANNWRLALQDVQNILGSTETKVRSMFASVAEGPKGAGGGVEGLFENTKALQEAEITAQLAHASRMAAMEKEQIESSAKILQLGETLKFALLTEAAAKERDIALGIIAQKIALAKEDPTHPEKVEAAEAERQAIMDKYAAEAQANNNKAQEARLAAERKTEAELKSIEDERYIRHLNDYKKEIDIITKFNEEYAAAKKKEADEQRRVDEEKETQNIAHQERMLKLETDRINLQRDLGLISTREQLEQLDAIEAKERELAAASAARRLSMATTGGDPREIARAQAEMQRVTDANQASMEASTRRHALAVKAVYDQLFNGIGTAFQSSVTQLIKGQTTLVGAFQNMGVQILSDWISMLARVVAQHLVSIISREAAELGLNKLLTALHIINAEESAAASAAQNVAEITGTAAVGAAHAYASTAAIPIVGPELAPAAAVEAYSAIIAFAPEGVFHNGGIVPYDMTAALQGGEMVLSPMLSDKIQNMTSGATTVHYHAGANETPDSIRRNKNELNKIMREMLRDGSFALA